MLLLNCPLLFSEKMKEVTTGIEPMVSGLSVLLNKVVSPLLFSVFTSLPELQPMQQENMPAAKSILINVLFILIDE